MAVIDLETRLPDGPVENRNSTKTDFIILNI